MKRVILILLSVTLLFVYSTGASAEIVVDNNNFDSFLFDAIVGGANTSGAPTAGPVYTNTNNVSLNFYINDNGIANINVPKLDEGNYNYVINYFGDSKYSSFENTGSIDVAKPDPEIVIPPLDKPSEDGSVAIKLPSDATGTVTFKYTYASFAPVFFTCGSLATVAFAANVCASASTHDGSCNSIFTCPTVNSFVAVAVSVKYANIPLIPKFKLEQEDSLEKMIFYAIVTLSIIIVFLYWGGNLV